MPILLFGKCVSADPHTDIKMVIPGRIEDGTAFTDYTITDTDTPDIDFDIPGVVYKIAFAVAFQATSNKDLFFAGHQFAAYFSNTDWGVLDDAVIPYGAIEDDPLSVPPWYESVPGWAHLEVAGGGNPAAIGFDDTPPASHTLFHGPAICNAFHETIPVFPETHTRTRPVYSSYNNLVGRAFLRDELIPINFEGVEYLRTTLSGIITLTDPCVAASQAPLKIRTWVYKDDNFVNPIGGTPYYGEHYSTYIELTSYVLVSIKSDPNY